MGSDNEYLEYLMAHKDCTKEFIEIASDPTSKHMNPNLEGVEDTINEMVSQVKFEIEDFEDSIHLAQLDENIYYCFVKSEHNIEFLLAKHLARRFIERIIIIGNLKFSYVAYFKDNDLIELYSSGLLGTLERFRELIYNNEKDIAMEDLLYFSKNYKLYPETNINGYPSDYRSLSIEHSPFQFNE